MMQARSSGAGSFTQPLHLKSSLFFLRNSKVSMSMIRVSFALHSSLSLGIIRLEMKMALDSEWLRMLVSSCSELSGRTGTATRPKAVRTGTATRPKAVAEKNATTQLGMFCEKIATRSPCLIPKRDIRWDRRSVLVRKSA